MKKAFAHLVMVLALTVVSASAKDNSVAGTWTFSSDGMTLRLVLKQKGKAVTGTLENPHGGTIPLKGEFADGQLTFSGSSDGPVHQLIVTATATLNADGSLRGQLTSNVGEMMWKAVRTKAK